MAKVEDMFDGVESKTLEKILVIDFMNLVFRTVNSNARANPLDLDFLLWKRGLVLTLFSYITQFKPDRCVIAMDAPVSWRKKYYSQYKAQRKDARDVSVIDYEKFFQVYKTFEEDLIASFPSLYWVKVENAEADDVIAYLAKSYSNSNVKVYCVSNDSDLHQLLKYKSYVQYDPIKKKIVDIFDPVKFLTAKILSGDVSDNIPNVCRGMGKKTADKEAGRIHDYLLTAPDEVKANFTRNKTLIDLASVPVEIENAIEECFDKYELKRSNGGEIYDFFVKHKQMRLVEDNQKYAFMLNKLQ